MTGTTTTNAPRNIPRRRHVRTAPRLIREPHGIRVVIHSRKESGGEKTRERRRTMRHRVHGSRISDSASVEASHLTFAIIPGNTRSHCPGPSTTTPSGRPGTLGATHGSPPLRFHPHSAQRQKEGSQGGAREGRKCNVRDAR